MVEEQKIPNSMYSEAHESFKALVCKVLDITSKAIEEKGYVSKRVIRRVSPTVNGYSETVDLVDDLIPSMSPSIHSLEEFNQCSQLIYENEFFLPQRSYCFVIVSSFIIDYLEGINPRTITFDQKRFDSIFEKYISALLSKSYESVWICPLIGFDSDIDSITLDDGLIIRKITHDDIDRVWNLIPIFDSEKSFKNKLFNTKYLMEHRLTKVSNSMYFYSGSDLIPTAVFSLRLFKNGTFWANREFQTILFPWTVKSPAIFGNTYSNMFLSNSYRYLFSKDESSDLKKIYSLVKRVNTIISAQKYKHVSMAIEWFKRYSNEINIEHQFIFLMLLMEVLCSDGNEIKYKLSNRISLIIGNDDQDRVDIIEKFGELYNKRSDLIHGRTLQIEKKDVLKAEDYSRRLLTNFLLFSLKGYSKKEVLNLIKTALVSEDGRKKLNEAINFEIV